MSYHAITDITSPNYTPAADCPAAFGTPRNIQSISIHHWGNMGQRFDDVARFLSTAANGRQSSAHYVVEAGKVACLVAPADAAWHAGNAYGNATSIGIECRPEATDGDYETVAELIAELREVYGDLPLVPHRDWVATACPGIWDLGRLDALARGTVPFLGNFQEAPAAQGWDPLVWNVDPGDTLGKIASHYGTTVDALVAHNGLPDANRIEVGQAIYIPGPLVWNVDPGDTLGKIADYYGVSVDRLVALNGIQDVNRIEVGASLVVQP